MASGTSQRRTPNSTHYLSDEDDVLPAELLLQLANQPHLDLLEGLQLRNRDKDDDSFPAATDFDFLRKHTRAAEGPSLAAHTQLQTGEPHPDSDT